MNIWQQLKQPFPVNAIHWRIGNTNKKKLEREAGGKSVRPTKGNAMAYINARDVMKRLDDVLGPENWRDDYEETPRGRVFCRLSLRVDGEWLTKTDAAGDTGMESEKGAVSDALKRAAVKFGIGRYLYYLDSKWVDLDKYGKFAIPTVPNWATPEGFSERMAQESVDPTVEPLPPDPVVEISEAVSEGRCKDVQLIYNGLDDPRGLWKTLNNHEKGQLRKVLQTAILDHGPMSDTEKVVAEVLSAMSADDPALTATHWCDLDQDGQFAANHYLDTKQSGYVKAAMFRLREVS